MKELSIEEKAKRYDKALERAEKALEVFGTDKCEGARQIFSLFPELKESDDEIMMHQLHSWMKEFSGAEEYTEKVYTWLKSLLEKQAQTFTKRDVDEAFVEGMAFAKNELEKQGEQKPTDNDMVEALRTEYEKGRADAFAEMQKEWSEEDERICCNIVNDIAIDKSMCKYNIEKGICDEQINWLKSLKQRIGG